MRGELPERIDPLHLADHRVRLEGVMPLRRFSRLKEFLVDDSGEVRFAANFARDQSQQRIMELDVAARLKCLCQRCMQPMDVDISAQTALALVEDEAQAERLGGRYESVVATSDRMSLVELVEDELLLRIPMIPKHELGRDCQNKVNGNSTPATGRRPFAALAAQKDRDTN